MRTPHIFKWFGVALLMGAGMTAFAAASAAPTVFLHYGQTGDSVVLLQKELNMSADTQIAQAGPGSPGQETSYFGPATLAAVKKFQLKSGIETTGYVGPLTLAALQKAVVPAAAATPSAPATSPAASSSPAAASSPLDAYVASVRAAGVAEGLSTDDLTQVEAAIRQTAATTTDYTAAFYIKQQQLYNRQHSALNQAWQKILSYVLPQTAQAFTGLQFGGYIAYVSPICTCNPIVQQIFVTLPQPTPTSNMTLDYIDGTEAFLWHNLPAPGLATLGAYTPGSQTCYFYTGHACIIIPAVGTIQPLVGSSATPI